MHDPAALRERIAEDGYLYLKNFHDKDAVLAARKFVTDRLVEQGIVDSRFPSTEGVLADVRVVNKRSALSSRAEDGRELKGYEPEDLTRGNKALWEMLESRRVMDFFGAFFGTPAHRFWYIWFRAVGRGKGTPPHCDWVYMSRGTPNLYTTWVPLGDTPLDVGGLMILEGSHKKADRLKNYLSKDVDDYCTDSPNAEKLKSGEMMFEFDGVLTRNPVSLQRSFGGRWLTAEHYEMGDVLIFTMRTIHASLDNQSNRIRISADTRYQPANEPADERWDVEGAVPYAKEYKRGRVC
jgi:ectoine hydroxylase-related dioxygenase (phytanoyl-CoA dioxygenase family)